MVAAGYPGLTVRKDESGNMKDEREDILGEILHFVQDDRSSMCHSEPFTFCHAEPFDCAQDKLREESLFGTCVSHEGYFR
jgi:hypothetical protein